MYMCNANDSNEFSEPKSKHNAAAMFRCLPTAGDMDRDPDDPVGEGVGLIASELGVPGAVPTPVPTPLELSLLFWPTESCGKRETEKIGIRTHSKSKNNVHYQPVLAQSNVSAESERAREGE